MSQTRREVIGGVAVFFGAYVIGSQTGGGSKEQLQGGGGGGGTEGDTTMTIYENPETAVVDTESDLDNYSPDSTPAFVLVQNQQLVYKIT